MNAVFGLLLAAGRGRRFGSDKLMYRLPDGMCLIAASARRLRATTDRTVALVRPNHPAMHEALLDLGVELIEVADAGAGAGMGNTLAAGIRATPRASGWVVALGDMPCVHHDTMFQVTQALRAGAVIAAPFHRGQRGHPVGFSRQWYDLLQDLDGDEGARQLLQAHRSAITRIDVDDPGCLFDVDSPHDVERMLGYARSGESKAVDQVAARADSA